MAQSGFTPLLIYSSSTATNVPSASNLLNNTVGAELAINITDGKLYYKDNAGVVQILASKLSTSTTISFGTTGLTPNTATSGAITVAGILNVANGGTGLATLTAGYIPYGNGTSALASNSGFTFTGTTLYSPTLLVTATTSTTPNLTFNASNSGITSGATVAGSYLQNVIQNKSGTAGASTNYVLSNDLGTDSTYYGEFGMNSSVYSSGTPADFFSLNNGIYFSGHDGDLSVGSGNGFKTYLAWGSTGQSAHVINASGAIGLNTNLGTTPALSGTTNFGTSGQPLLSGGSSATPTWGTLSVGGGGTGLTTLTAGYIPYGNGTSAFSNSANLSFNTSNGNGLLNIGQASTASVGTALYLNGTSNSANGTSIIGQRNASNAWLIGDFQSAFGSGSGFVTYVYGANNTYWYNNGVTTMTLDATGNLGIGGTPSAWDTTYKAIQLSAGGFVASATGAYAAYIGNNAYYNGGWKYLASTASSLYYNQTGSHYWFTAPSGTAGNAITFTTAMTLDGSGNLGIGTTSFSNKLTVVTSGTSLAAFQGAQYSQIRHSDGTRVLYTQVYSNEARLFTETSTPLLFGTNNLENMRLDTSGNLLIGTATNIYPSTGRTVLNINGTSQSLFGMQVGGVAKAYILHDGTDQSFYNQANGSQIFGTNNAEIMRILNNGNLGVGTTNPLAKINASGTYPLASCSIRTTNLSANGFSSYEFAEGTTVQGQIWAGNSTYASFGGISSLNYSANGGPHVWYVNYVEFMRLNASGNLGLGVTPSAWSGIKAIEMGSGVYFGTNTGIGMYIGSNNYYNGTNYIYKTSAQASQYQQNIGQHIWSIAPTGTAGNAITFTQAMTLDNSGNLGIGTNTPSSYGKLTVWGGDIYVQATTGGVASKITLANTLNSVTLKSAPVGSGADMQFETNSILRMTLDQIGNLGLGVTPSNLYTAGRAIQVGAAGGATLYGSTSTLALSINTNIDVSGNYTYASTNYALNYKQVSGVHAWYTAPSGTSGNAITFTQAMTLDNSGNLGIGITPSVWDSAYKALDISGNVGICGYSNSLYVLANAYVNGGVYKYKASTFATLELQTNGQFQWYTAPSGTAGTAITFTQAMTLDNSGNLGIGVTPVAGYGTSLQLQQRGGGATVSFIQQSITTNNQLLFIGNNALPPSGAYTGNYNYTWTGANASAYTQQAGLHSWISAATGTAGNVITFTNGMYFDASGNLGVGLSPAAAGFGTSLQLRQQNSNGATVTLLHQSIATNNQLLALSNNAIPPSGAYTGNYNYTYTGASATLYTQLAGAHTWYNAPTGTAGNTITFTQEMTLDNSGNLGLGVTPSAWGSGIKALDLSSAGAIIASGNSTEMYLNSYYNGTNFIYKNTGVATKYEQSLGAHKWWNAPSGTGGTAVTFTQAMILDTAGNLGLGVIPSASWGSSVKAIQVNQTASFAGYTNGSNQQTWVFNNLYFDGSVNKYITSNYATYYSQYAGTHQWWIAPSGTAGATATSTQAMTLNELGFLLVGRTAVTSGYSSSINSTANGVTNYGHNIQNSSATLTTFESFTNNSGVIAGSITQATSTSVAFNATSDQRLKTNIVNSPPGNIDQIKVRSFDWVTDNTHQEYGLVAQELVEVAPYAVHQPSNPDEMMAIDYSKLVPMMIKEIQDLKQRINTLEKR